MKYNKDYVRKVFEGEAPCDKCDQADSCKENEWACRAFSFYVINGRFEQYTARMPTRFIFEKIFKEDERELKHWLKSIQAKEPMNKGKNEQ